MDSTVNRRTARTQVRRLFLATLLALMLVASAVSVVAAGTLAPCLNRAALPGVFGALFGSALEASSQAHESQPLGATISSFGHVHADPTAGDCA
jgi:hypothetical protein